METIAWDALEEIELKTRDIRLTPELALWAIRKRIEIARKLAKKHEKAADHA